MQQLTIPDVGLLLLWQFCSDHKRGISPLSPIRRSAWWAAGVASGRFHFGVLFCPPTRVSADGSIPSNTAGAMAKLNAKKVTA